MADLVFTTNRTAAPVRRETWNGREWLVAPVVGLVPGVLNGELVTREAVKPTERAWENVPLVIEHPQRDGQFISAQEEGVQHVGMLRKPNVNGKLQGEMWYDVEALVSTGSTGEKVMAALEAGEMLEVSTAYFRSVEERAGVHNGRAYQSVAHDLTPDHLAVLLSGLGSCSIDDGCGVPRVNQMSQARRPAFQGTETGSWEAVDRSMGAYMRGYMKHSGSSMDEMPANVGEMPAAMKRWIASKSLLGDQDAEDLRGLSFFPVVNPGTNKLNRGALVAVLGGRAAQAKIPQAAIDSAQAVARRLLESQFKANQSSVTKFQLSVNAEHGGAMVAFFLPEADANALAVDVRSLPPGSSAVPPGELHVTLAYLGDVAELETEGRDQGRVLEGLNYFASEHTLVRGRVNGVARFVQKQEDGSQAVVALLDSPMLERWRGHLLAMLDGYCNMSPARNHAFTPHITLAYVPADAPMPDIPVEERALVFDKVALAWGGQATAFGLRGESMDMQTNEAAEAAKKKTIKSALRSIAGVFGINLKEADMDKNELIRQLVANEKCPLEQSALEKLSPEELQTLAGAFAPVQENEPAANADGGAGFDTVDKNHPPTQPADNGTLVQLTEVVTALKTQVETLIANQKTAEDAEKSRLVAELVANNAPLPKAALEKLDVGELQTLAQSLIPADYSLQTLGRQNTGEWLSWDEYIEKQAAATGAGSTGSPANGGK